MNIQNHVQIAKLLTLQEHLCASLRRFMNAQTVNELSLNSTEIILLQIEMMNQVQRMMLELATESVDGGGDEIPF